MGILRKPHAVLNLESRKLKALKIEKVLNLIQPLMPCRLLDIGTGSGGIAHYFASKKYIVDSVDVIDSRKVLDSYSFHLIESCSLPFDKETFDVVITNHVIEHVGEYTNQLEHLKEIKRVLKPSGIGYLAVPNRWMLIEPHYKLIFLSWLPKQLRSPYLKFMNKGDFYDCEPLTVKEIEGLFECIGFSYKNRSVEAMKIFFAIENPNHWFTKIIRVIPDFLFRLFLGVMPTLIYSFKEDV